MPSQTPATYVALLRGINVGGNNVIPMSALVKTFERMGLDSVKTYIASGNVLFRTRVTEPRALEARIESALSKAHAYDARVVLRSHAEMARHVQDLPRAWKRVDPKMRYNLLFLRHEVDSESILEGLALKPGIEQIWYRPGVLYWSAHTSDLARTSMVKLASRAIYKHVTVRNLNTTRKILELMDAMT
jgi:uncharacterized protein (DUF1697 family)